MQLLPSINKDVLDLARRAVVALETIAEHLAQDDQSAGIDQREGWQR